MRTPRQKMWPKCTSGRTPNSYAAGGWIGIAGNSRSPKAWWKKSRSSARRREVGNELDSFTLARCHPEGTRGTRLRILQGSRLVSRVEILRGYAQDDMRCFFFVGVSFNHVRTVSNYPPRHPQ